MIHIIQSVFLYTFHEHYNHILAQIQCHLKKVASSDFLLSAKHDVECISISEVSILLDVF